MATFFPNLVFSWAFVGVLGALLIVAAYVDFRTFLIPKSIVFALLGSGLVANLVRGAWLGAQGQTGFLFGGTWWLGLLDGFLFSLIGFLAAFALLFILWILKTCGGGDVKLMAALGAWLGPVLFFYVYLLSVVLLFVLAVVSVVMALTAGKPATPTKGKTPGKAPRWRASYSLPVAIATLVVLLWCCRVDLGLSPGTETPSGKVVTRAP